jgi:hypothetical protein
MSDASPPDAAALYRLMAWLSPAYPVGAFSYSSGIEWAVEAGDIKDAETLRAWLAVMIGEGGGFCDAVLFVHAHRAIAANDDAGLRAVAELAAALVPSKERLLETTTQGRAFLDATRAAWPCEALMHLDAAWNGAVALPVAVGVACAGHGIACEGGPAGVPACAYGKLDFRRRPPHPARPDRRPARARGPRSNRRGNGNARAQDDARRRRLECATRRSVKHAARDAIYAPIPVVMSVRLAVFVSRHRRRAGTTAWTNPAPRW